LIPESIDRSVFFVVVRNLSALLVLVGLPAVVLGPYSALGRTFGELWTVSLPVLPLQLYPLQSIYTNPNFLSVFLIGGLITSLYMYDLRSTKSSLMICLINGAGVYLTQSRSGILVGIVAVFGYLLYKIWGLSLFRILFLGGIPLGLGGFFLLLTGIGPLSEISLSGRRDLWQAGIQLLLESPFTGYGQVKLKPIIAVELGTPKSPHNSYLRVFLESGIIGGIAYLCLVIVPIINHILIPLNKEQVTSFLLATSIALVMIFETFVLGGVGSSSVLATIALGYLIKDINDYGTTNHGATDR
jgi:O-antigen ligase